MSRDETRAGARRQVRIQAEKFWSKFEKQKREAAKKKEKAKEEENGKAE